MKVISFDVGIKNMAYCIFEISGNQFNINNWKIMDLVSNDSVEKKFCEHLQKNGTKCKNIARFTCNNKSYCKTHGEKSGIPLYSKELKKSTLQKKNTDELEELCKKSFIKLEKNTKACMVKTLAEHYLKICLHPYKQKKILCDDYDLIHIGKEMKKQGHKLFDNDINLVLIENQISPIANRMKTIQGMLAQFFIMKIDDIDIKFISSQNKLKYFNKNKDSNKKNNYKDNKKNGILYTNEILEKYNMTNWKTCLDTTKKDDLADAFLQGVWYIENNILNA